MSPGKKLEGHIQSDPRTVPNTAWWPVVFLRFCRALFRIRAATGDGLHHEPQSGCRWRRSAANARDASDLILIHNEKKISGDQPRIVLDPLTVLLPVSTWERLIFDLGVGDEVTMCVFYRGFRGWCGMLQNRILS